MAVKIGTKVEIALGPYRGQRGTVTALGQDGWNVKLADGRIIVSNSVLVLRNQK